MRVFHCEQLMRTTRIPLISGRIQYDNHCVVCGHEERDIYSSSGRALVWLNVTLRKKLDAAAVESA